MIFEKIIEIAKYYDWESIFRGSLLNLCRFYALIRDDLTLSKYDGGKWALENMDSNYNDVIKNAMEDYLSDTNNSYDNTRLKEFAGEAISLINDCVNTNKIRK